MPESGSLILQGAENLTTGLNNYAQLQSQDAAATGRINAFLQNAQNNPQATQGLSPNAQTLLQKQMSGKANYNDRLSLLGELTANQDIQAAQANRQNIQAQAALATSQGQEASARGNFANAQANQLNMRNQMLQGLMNPGQGPAQPNQGAMSQYAQPTGGGAQPAPDAMASFAPQGGTGRPAPTPMAGVQLPPPTPVQVTDPQIQALYPQAFKTTLGDPDKASDLLQKIADRQNANAMAGYQAKQDATAPTGNFYLKEVLSKEGLPQGLVLTPEVIKGKGTMSESLMDGPGEVTVPFGTPPPGPIIQRGTGKPDLTPEMAAMNDNDPDVIKETADAFNTVGIDQARLAQASLFRDAANAYATGGSGQLNAILGQPQFAKMAQMFSGTNKVAALKAAMAGNTSAVINQVRDPKNGSIGGRMLQTEYENTSTMLGGPEMDPTTIKAAADNLYNAVDRQTNIDHAYAIYRQTMPANKAQKLAIAQFGGPPNLINPVNGAPVKKGAMAPIKIMTKAQRDSLPSNTPYIGPDGIPAST